jgi:hypothetical protein
MITDLRDTVQNFMTLMGSEIDPNYQTRVGSACDIDIYQWRRNGGVAKKILEFWPDKMASGFEINVGAGYRKNNGAGKQRALIIKEWLESEFKRINLLSTLRTAELQCHVDKAAPMVVLTDGTEPLSQFPRRYKNVSRLVIQDPCFFEPVAGVGLGTMHAINHDLVSAYSSQMSDAFAVNGAVVDAGRVLALQGEALLPSERHGSWLERRWGRRLIGDAVIDAALKLDLAIAATSILIQQKNFAVMKVKGLLQAITGMSNGDRAAVNDIIQTLKALESGKNLLNAHIIDMENQDISYVERNLSGVDAAVQKLKENLLMHVANIPESYLFGMNSRGGLQRGTTEDKQVDSRANELFEQRWIPILNKLLILMLNGRGCPVKGFDPSLISISRKSSYTPDPIEQAKLRSELVKSDAVLIDKLVITPEEARQRESGAGYQLDLNL